MKKVKVQLAPLGKTIQVNEGTPLIDILHEYGVEFPCGGKGTCGKCRVKVLEGEINTSDYHENIIRALDLEENWKLACLSKCSADLKLEVAQYETIIQADESHFEFTPGKGIGVAFDLGTTTLVGQLLNLANGKILAVETDLNPQKVFGSDLISRLESAMQHGAGEMTMLIRRKIESMIGKMLSKSDRSIDKVVIVGNTVMQHLFCGYDITPLSFYPFDTPHLHGTKLSSGDLGWERVKCEKISFIPSVESFVGSDILAGIFATGMFKKKDPTVLIDLGTNGEIVAGNRDQLLCASTAAGPAFEGARISQGMLATTGAISSVVQNDAGKGWNCTVIGNSESTGICGSGLIDAVSVLLEKGLIGDFGEITSGNTEIDLDSRVKLTQKDIQEFQLAKAAIATGLEILLRKIGIRTDEVSEVYLAGGFGNYINLDNVNQVGMLNFPREKMHKLGNSALMGAKMFLFENNKLPENILKHVGHVSLESEPDFQDMFVNNLSFS